MVGKPKDVYPPYSTDEGSPPKPENKLSCKYFCWTSSCQSNLRAQRLPTDINMIHRMLYLEGEYISFGSEQPIAFKVDIAKAPLPRHLALFNPLTLSSEHRTARLVVSIHYDRWFDGLDLSA
jgi:hypothetical protein